MKNYIPNNTIDFMNFEVNSTSKYFEIEYKNSKLVLGSLINQYCLFNGMEHRDEVKKIIYDVFLEIKEKYFDFTWVWNEHHEHYNMTPIIVFLNNIWKDLNIKKELIVITSDIHIDYTSIFESGKYYFTLYNMLLHKNNLDFFYEDVNNCKYKLFLQGGRQKNDRDYLFKQIKDYITEKNCITTISKNNNNNGSNEQGEFKYKFKEMFRLINQSSFMIVNETIRSQSDYLNDRFRGACSGYTEKTGNAIVFKKPFLLNSNPHSLYNLKQLGFKTFGDFWDESYDECINQKDRLNHISEIIKWFLTLSEDEILVLKQNLKDILDFNYNHLLELTNHTKEGYRLFQSSDFSFKL